MERRLFYTVVFVLGISGPHLTASSFAICLAGLLIVALWHPRLSRPAVCGCALLILGIGVARGYWDTCSSVLPYQKVQVEGVILEPPRTWGRSSVFFFRIEKWNGRPVRACKVLVRWNQCEQTLEVGDEWALEGRHTTGESASYPGGFDQKSWLWSQRATGVLLLHQHSSHHFLRPPTGITPHQLSYRARAWMMQRLRKMENENARALVAGVVFGETQSLPRELQDQFRRTGTSHLLAASGMNVALLAGLIVFGGRCLGLGAWRVAPLAIPAVIGYAFLAGCSPSITRAAVGTTLALTALSLGRTSNAWNTLSLSIWVLLIWDPRQLFDLGFQLSVVAVVGLISGPAAPKKLGFLVGSIVLTISASLATLPIFWTSFGELSSTLLLANLILGPIVELLFPLGLLVTVMPVRPLLFLVETLAQWSLWLVGWLSRLGDPILLAPPGPGEWLLVGAALLCWMKGKSWKVRWLALPLVGLAVSISVMTGLEPTCHPGELKVRRVGLSKPVYWISTHTREVLILDGAWQEKRARDILREMGCLAEPELRVLDGTNLRFRWGEFRWHDVEPYIPDGSFVEVVVTADGYTLKRWDPD